MGHGRDSPLPANRCNDPIDAMEPAKAGSMACPSNYELAAHLASDEDDPGSLIANHLLGCARCQRLVNILNTAVRVYAK